MRNEVIAKRSRHGKVWKIDPDSEGRERFEGQISIEPQHYQRAGEKDMREIDTRWTTDARGKLRLRDAPFRLIMREDTIGVRFVDRNEGYRIDMELIRVDATPIADLTLNMNPVVAGKIVKFPDVLPDLDIHLRAANGRVQWIAIMKSAKAPRSFVWQVTEDAEATDDKVTVGEIPSNGSDANRNRLEVRSKQRSANELINGRRRYRTRTAWTGRVIVADPVTRVKSFTDTVVYPVRLM